MHMLFLNVDNLTEYQHNLNNLYIYFENISNNLHSLNPKEKETFDSTFQISIMNLSKQIKKR